MTLIRIPTTSSSATFCSTLPGALATLRTAFTPRALAPALAWMLLAGFSFCLTGCGALSEPGSEASTASASTAAREGDDTIVLVLDGRDVTQAELHAHMQEQFLDELLRQSESELFTMREKAARDLVRRHVIDVAAAERGTTAEALFDEISASAAPATLEDVTSWYAENQARLRGAPLQDVAERIKELLYDEARYTAWGDFVGPRLEALEWELLIDPPRAELTATSLIRGNPEAPITLMSFSDYQCPYCIRSELVLNEVLARYPDQVRLIHRHFPLESIHPFARPASEAAMCAEEQGRFWDFHDAIFAREGRLSSASFGEIAAELDLDATALTECIDEGRYREAVQADLVEGTEAGVTGTPAFFVNGIALKGAQDADEISRLIDAELLRLQAN